MRFPSQRVADSSTPEFATRPRPCRFMTRHDEDARLRNRPIHGYEDVDLDIVWQTVSEDLPKLIGALEKAVGG